MGEATEQFIMNPGALRMDGAFRRAGVEDSVRPASEGFRIEASFV